MGRALLILLLLLLPVSAIAQELSISLGDEGALSARTFQLIALITVLSLAPGLAIMITCFPFLVTVLSILRQAIGLQQSPPNMLIVSLALFLTYFVMEPVFTAAWTEGLKPLTEDEISAEDAFARTLGPFREFMAARLDVDTFLAMADLRPDTQGIALSPGGPCAKFYAVRDRTGISDRLSLLHAVSDYRSCGRRNPDVDGHDDGAACDRLTSVQTGLLRCGRRLEPYRRQSGAQLFLGSSTPQRPGSTCLRASGQSRD